MTTPGMLTISTVSTVGAVAEAEWTRLAERGGLAVSRPYLASVEADAGVPVTYALARDGQGRLAGALPAYSWSGDGDNLQYYSPHAVLTRREQRRRWPGETWFPLRLIGTRSAYWNEFLVDPALGGDRREGVIAELLATAAGPASGPAPAALALMYLTPTAAAEARRLLPAEARVLLTTADACLDIAWDDFDGYLAHLSGKRRRSARQEMALFASRGLAVTICRLRDCWDRVGPLLANVQRRHGIPMTDDEATAHLGAQVQVLDDHSVVFLGEAGDRPAAFCLFYRWGRRMFGRLVGIDDALTEGAAAYFNLGYYLPIRYAIEHGVESIWFGPTAWRTKLLRGARLEPRWSAVVPPAELAGEWYQAVNGWNDAIHGMWSEQAASLGVALSDDLWRLERLCERPA